MRAAAEESAAAGVVGAGATDSKVHPVTANHAAMSNLLVPAIQTMRRRIKIRLPSHRKANRMPMAGPAAVGRDGNAEADAAAVDDPIQTGQREAQHNRRLHLRLLRFKMRPPQRGKSASRDDRCIEPPASPFLLPLASPHQWTSNPISAADHHDASIAKLPIQTVDRAWLDRIDRRQRADGGGSPAGETTV
jgi:hypothetical protein